MKTNTISVNTKKLLAIIAEQDKIEVGAVPKPAPADSEAKAAAMGEAWVLGKAGTTALAT